MTRLDGDELPVYSPVCMTCRHFRADVDGRTCDAFPDGIPPAIWRGDNLHREPFAGDRGIRYSRGRPRGLPRD